MSSLLNRICPPNDAGQYSTCDSRFDAPSTGESGEGRMPLTGLKSAHVPCVGVTLPWRAKNEQISWKRAERGVNGEKHLYG